MLYKLKNVFHINLKIKNIILITLFLISILNLFAVTVTACHTVGTYESDFETPKTTFMQGAIVYGKVTHSPDEHLMLRIRDPSNNVVFSSEYPEYGSEVKCEYGLDDNAPLGVWNIQLGLYIEGSWCWYTGSGCTSYFNVIESPKYVIDTYVTGSGTVSKNPNQEDYAKGTVVTLTAEPGNGWKFDHWSGDLSGSNNPKTITMDNDKTITAHFVESESNGDFEKKSSSDKKPNKPPIADPSAGELYIGVINKELEFDATLSYDNDGHITEWFWNFGDGTTALGEITTHTYSNPGNYNVILIVTDNKGAWDSDMTSAIITLPNHPPSEPMINGPAEGLVYDEYLFSIVSTDEDNDEIKYTIYWGDGDIDESESLPSGTLLRITHKWNTVGSYTIKATANDGEAISSSEIIIIIKEPVPEEENIILLFLALLALILLILALIIIKRKKDKK